MTFTLILIAFPALVLTLAVVDRRRHREAGLPTLDRYAGVLTDLGPDGPTGFPGPRWLGVR